MTDITMCVNKLCQKANHCMRATSKHSDWQSVAMYEYKVSREGFKCNYFIDDSPKTFTANNTR